MQQSETLFETPIFVKVVDHNMVPAGLYRLKIDEEEFEQIEHIVSSLNYSASKLSPKDPFGLIGYFL